MKNILPTLVLICTLLSCSKDTDHTSNTEKEIYAVTRILSGKFVGSLYSSVTNTTETEEITFSPYQSAKEVVSILDGKIDAHGTAVVVKYFNDHLLESTKDCYYSVKVVYAGAQPTISFYPYNIEKGEIINNENKRDIIIISDQSFKIGSVTFIKE